MIFISEAEDLKKRVEELEKENAELKTRLNRAKNANPRERVSWLVVKRLVDNCGLFLEKASNGWEISMGSAKRIFKRLKDVWLFFSANEWYISDLFPQLDPPPQPQEKPKPKPRTVQPKVPQRNPSLAPALIASDSSYYAPRKSWLDTCLEAIELPIPFCEDG